MTNDHVFPQHEIVQPEAPMGDYMQQSTGGLTLRQYYAGLAMQGMLAEGEWWEAFKGDDGEPCTRWFASIAVQQADALIKALEKK